MYILDTCILNILFFYPSDKRDAITRQLNEVDRSDVFISAISAYELIGIGVVPEINRTINSSDAAKNLLALTTLVDKLSDFQTLPFTKDDHTLFVSIEAAIKRKGVMDARIAASALSNDFIVVTEDEEVFDLAGARHVNWARPAA